MKHNLITPKYIVVTPRNIPQKKIIITKIQNRSNVPFCFAMEEGAKGPQIGPKGPLPSAGARRRGAECPKLLV